MVTLSFTIFSRQKNHNRAHMLFQYLSGFEPILYTTHTNEEPFFLGDFICSERSGVNQFLLGELTLKGRDCGKNWYDLAEAYAERHNIATDNTLDIKSNPRWKGLKSIEVSRRYDRILVRNTYPMDLPILEKCETFGRTISEKVDMLRVIIMECMRIFILFDCKGV